MQQNIAKKNCKKKPNFYFILFSYLTFIDLVLK